MSTLHLLDISTTPATSVTDLHIPDAQQFDIVGTSMVAISDVGNAFRFYDLSNDSLTPEMGFTLPGVPFQVQIGGGRAYVRWFQEPGDNEGITVFDVEHRTRLADLPFDLDRIHGGGGLAIRDDAAYLSSTPGGAIVTNPSRPEILLNSIFPISLAISAAVGTA